MVENKMSGLKLKSEVELFNYLGEYFVKNEIELTLQNLTQSSDFKFRSDLFLSKGDKTAIVEVKFLDGISKMPSNHALKFLERSRIDKIFNDGKKHLGFLISNAEISKDLNEVLKNNGVIFFCLKDQPLEQVTNAILSFLKS